VIVRGRIEAEPRRGRRTEPVGAPARDQGRTRAERCERQLALAVWIERKIEAGELRNYAHAARVLGVSRARVSQITSAFTFVRDHSIGYTVVRRPSSLENSSGCTTCKPCPARKRSQAPCAVASLDRPAQAGPPDPVQV